MDKSNSAEDPKKQTTTKELPDSVLDEVLIRLPFTDLNQSRLVSREWNERITHQSFVERVKSKHGTKANICVHEVLFYSLGPNVMTLKLDPIIMETYAPLSGVWFPHILGSVNDMVLFGNEDCSYLYMINPTNHTLWRIEDEGPESFDELYGFGYNQAESYVIVKVIQDEEENSAFVYSHRRRAWEKKILNRLKYKIHDSVGFFNGRLYFHDRVNLLGFDLNMEDFWVIQLPEDMRNVNLEFGVVREKLAGSEQIREVLLICCRNSKTGIHSIFRLMKGEDVEVFEEIAAWDNFATVLQPLAYYLGDPNRIVILEDRRVIVVYNVRENSKIEIYRQEDEMFPKTYAAAFYHTSLPSKGEVLTMKTGETTGTKRKRETGETSGTKRKRGDHTDEMC